LEDAALDYYLSGAGWANVKSVGRTAAFYYLDYTSRRDFAATIHPEDFYEKNYFDAETTALGEEYASWAREQLKYDHLAYEEQILLLLRAEVKYDQEYMRYIYSLERFRNEAAIWRAGEGKPPRPPRLNYDRSIRALELIAAGHPGSPAALYAWYFLGCIYTDLGDASSSKRALTRVLEWVGDNSYRDEAGLRLADIKLREGEYSAAESLYDSIEEGAEFYADALYGLAYVNYVLAGIEGHPKRDENVVSYFGELYRISENELITEYCANLAISSLISLGGYTYIPQPEDATVIVSKYSKQIDNPSAETYLINMMGELLEKNGTNP
jgi:hypothetical protein